MASLAIGTILGGLFALALGFIFFPRRKRRVGFIRYKVTRQLMRRLDRENKKFTSKNC